MKQMKFFFLLFNILKCPKTTKIIECPFPKNIFEYVLKKIQDFIFYLFLKHKTTMNGIKSPFQMF